MSKKHLRVLPESQDVLKGLGERIKLARLRRRLSVDEVAAMAEICRTTLWSIEKGGAAVAIGAYVAVLHVLDNMDEDFSFVAKDELFASKIKGVNLNSRIRKTNSGE